MIRYALRCERDHTFESWFQSSSAYESQVKRKLVECPTCGSTKVEKAIMAPRIVSKKGRDAAPVPAAPVPAPAPEVIPPGPTSLLMAQERELRAKLKELRDHIVKNADDVGERFPTEARKMHYGETEHRPIYGEASIEEARELIEEGIEVAPIQMIGTEARRVDHQRRIQFCVPSIRTSSLRAQRSNPESRPQPWIASLRSQ